MLFFFLPFPNRSAKTGVNNKKIFIHGLINTYTRTFDFRDRRWKCNQAILFFSLFNPGESLPLSRLLLFLPHVPPTSCAGITSWFDVLPTHHHTVFFFFLSFFFLDILLPVPFSHFSLTRLVLTSPAPTTSFPIESGFWLHHGQKNINKTYHFVFQYNQELMRPAPFCPYGGNIAMLQRCNCANRVGGSQRQCRTWSCPMIKLQWFIYFSFRSTKCLFFGLLLTILISEICFLEP